MQTTTPNKKFQITYSVADRCKSITGTALSEDAEFITIRSDWKGDIFKIQKKQIQEIVELAPSKGGVKE